MVEVIVTAIGGLLATVVGSLCTYLSQKKKQASETKQTDVDTMHKQFEFYQKIGTHNTDVLTTYLKQIDELKEQKDSLEEKMDKLLRENKELKEQIADLKATLDKFASQLCGVTDCAKRVHLIQK
jgi:chromosome segregation ATPase